MLKVIGWVDYDNYNFRTAKGTEEEINAVAQDIRENGYKFGGDDHENHINCCPLLSSGKVLRESWRGWGYVMAVAYDLKTDKGEYNYILWYMGEYGPENRVFPKGIDTETISSKDLPKGKEYVYGLCEEEIHAIYNASFCGLVLPEEYFETIGLKAFDRVIFKENDKTLLTTYVNDIRFARYTIEELLKKDNDLNISPSENTNFSDFSEGQLKEFIKKKYNIDSDNLIVICCDNEEDNRDSDKIYV